MLNLKNSLLVGASVSAFAVFAAPAFAQDNGGSNETVIVTGTRVQGMTAADSAAPITVLGSDALTKGTGSTDLRQALGQTVPSFVAQQYGGDTANLTLSAALRGLSPNDTLVLVNGKRRHYTGNLHVDAGGLPRAVPPPTFPSFRKARSITSKCCWMAPPRSTAPTPSPASSTSSSRRNPRAAGFGHRGRLLYRRQQQLGRGGGTYDVSYNMGLPLFDKGFVNFTVEKSFSNFTQYGGGDNRYLNAQGNPVAQQTVTSVGANGVASLSPGNGVPNSFLPTVTGYPRANAIDGSPQ